MITIVFSANPEKAKRTINKQRYRIGARQFTTKRAAAIWLADSGRRATAWILEIQELHRLAVYGGQAHASTMELMELATWARLKAEFDQRYIALRRNARSWTPGEMFPRLRGLCNTVAQMADMVREMGTRGDQVQAQIITSRCLQIVTEIDGWAATG